MPLYRILFGVDALIAAIVAYFFLWGLSDGSVSSFNIGLWLAILAGVGVVLVGGLTLRRKGMLAPANAVLAILALPGLLFGLFFLALIVTPGRWN